MPIIIVLDTAGAGQENNNLCNLKSLVTESVEATELGSDCAVPFFARRLLLSVCLEEFADLNRDTIQILLDR